MSRWRSTEPFRFPYKEGFLKGNQSWAKKEAYELFSTRHGEFDRPFKKEYASNFALCELDYQGAEDTLYYTSPYSSLVPSNRTPDLIGVTLQNIIIQGKVCAIIDITRAPSHYFGLFYTPDYKFVVARSINGGTWTHVTELASGPTPISDITPYGCIAAQSDLVCFVAYGATVRDTYKIYIRTTTNGGISWGATSSVFNLAFDLYSKATAHIFASNDWRIFNLGGPGENPHSYYHAYSLDQGSSWSRDSSTYSNVDASGTVGDNHYFTWSNDLMRVVGGSQTTINSDFDGSDVSTFLGDGFAGHDDTILISRLRRIGSTNYYPAIYKSTNGGTSFTCVYTFTDRNWGASSAATTSHAGLVYHAGTYYWHFWHATQQLIPVFYESTDEGATWKESDLLFCADTAPFVMWPRLQFRAKIQNNRMMLTMGGWQVILKEL